MFTLHLGRRRISRIFCLAKLYNLDLDPKSHFEENLTINWVNVTIWHGKSCKLKKKSKKFSRGFQSSPDESARTFKIQAYLSKTLVEPLQNANIRSHSCFFILIFIVIDFNCLIVFTKNVLWYPFVETLAVS